jgi:NhaP-type Na+/H+ or K+/H+ antiporter
MDSTSLYQNAAILAAFALLYSAAAGRVERSWLSGPIVFTGVGLLLGPAVLDALRINITAEGLRILAELTLAMVLFTDAARCDFGVVSGALGLPERLLAIGLPLTIGFGFVAALAIFPGLGVLEAALLASLLAPTDAALGAPVIANPSVPAATREALNIESGLNDGICVPVVVILLQFAVGTEIEGSTLGHMAYVVIEEVAIGLLAGLGLTGIAAPLLWIAEKHRWTSEHWLDIPVVALAGLCFASAQALGGSGFIACFTGGLLFGLLRRDCGHHLLHGASSTGEALALVTWLLFGAVVLGRMLDRLTWPGLLYAVLSLTVIRMLPVFLSLTGVRMSTAEKLFIGWFGPRGLASIVFGIIIFDAKLPGNEIIVTTAVATVLLSVVAHGMSANPLVRVLGARTQAGKREG